MSNAITRVYRFGFRVSGLGVQDVGLRSLRVQGLWVWGLSVYDSTAPAHQNSHAKSASGRTKQQNNLKPLPS